MVENIPFTVEPDYAVVVVSAYAKELTRIFQDRTLVLPRTHGIAAGHVGDFTGIIDNAAPGIGSVREVGTVCVVVGAVVFKDISGFEKPGRRHNLRRSRQADHIVTQFDHTGGVGHLILSLGHAAAEVEIAVALRIKHHGGIKQPNHIGVGCIAGHEGIADRIAERPHGAVACQHANTICIVGEIEEKAILTVNVFVHCRRRPRVTGPRGKAPPWRPDLDPAVISPVDQIVRGDKADGTNQPVLVFNHHARGCLDDSIVGRVNIHPAVIDQSIRIRTKPMRQDGIVIADRFVGGSDLQPGKQRRRIKCSARPRALGSENTAACA